MFNMTKANKQTNNHPSFVLCTPALSAHTYNFPFEFGVRPYFCKAKRKTGQKKNAIKMTQQKHSANHSNCPLSSVPKKSVSNP